MTYEHPADLAYRRLYYYLHNLVERAIWRILEPLDESAVANDTIVVFTSDQRQLLDAHGGIQQKWYNAFGEAIRVPLVKGAGVMVTPAGVTISTQPGRSHPHPDGAAGIDTERTAAGVAEHHDEAQPRSGRT
jgi:choline-sulfatase